MRTVHDVSRAGASLLFTAFLLAAPAAADQEARNEPEAAAGDEKAAEAQVARGKYLVTIAGCNDCHTPLEMGPNGPEPDMDRMLSGHPENLEMPPAPDLPDGPWLVTAASTNTAWAGPWGVSSTANLTPDRETGLGEWTLPEFMATIRTGRHLGRGRAILPPMPIPMYKHMTDEDLTAVFAYLQSIPPVENDVPSPRPMSE